MSRRSSALLLLLGVDGASGFAYPDTRVRWTLPYDSLSQEGLSRKLRYALHPDFCKQLRSKFVESKQASAFGAVGLVRCEELEETMNRAFKAWAFNNKRVDFYNATGYCTAEELAASQCEAVQIMVVASSTGTGTPGGVTLTTSENPPIDTSGVDTLMSWYPDPSEPGYVESLGGYVSGDIPAEPARMAAPGNVVAGDRTITHVLVNFNADSDICWYLDDTFCRSFWKSSVNAEKVLVGFYTTCVTIGVLMLMYRGARLWGGLIIKGKEFAHKILLLHLSHFYVTWTMAVLIIVPNALYYGMFKSCVDCYSFEATAVHLVGQSLGIGVLDADATTMSVLQRPTSEGVEKVVMGMEDQSGELNYGRVCQKAYVLPKMGNSYLAETDWTEECDDPDDPWTCENRDHSVMLPLDHHHSRPCLSKDDLDALNWLYPSCYGANTEPICVRSDRNHTIIKVLAMCGFPLFITMWGSFVALLYSRYRQKKRLQKQKLMHHCLNLFGDKAKDLFDKTDAARKEKNKARQAKILAQMKAHEHHVMHSLDPVRSVSIKKASRSIARGGKAALHAMKRSHVDGDTPHFAVDTRVVHPKHGVGIVVELMHNGRTRVVFDSGDEHRYKPDSLKKLSEYHESAPGLSYHTSNVDEATKTERRNKLRGARNESFMPSMPTVGVLNKKQSSCAASVQEESVPEESPGEAGEQAATSEAQV